MGELRLRSESGPESQPNRPRNRPRIPRLKSYNHRILQLASSTPIPDGLLATIALRNENSRLGVPSSEAALHLGHDASKSEIVLGIEAADSTTRVRSSDTGKERDAESGNDYFEARYYSSAMGRFLSPDWTAQEEPVPYASLDDPQTLNLYAYVRNNPLTSVDSDGHAFCPGWCDLTGMAFQTQSETEAAERAYNAQAGYGKVTNAQLSQRVAEQRSFLLSLPGLNDATKTQLASAADPIIFHLYMCETASDCGPTRYDPRGILLTGPQVAGAIDPSSIETHHMLPQNETMKSFFEKRGLDVEDFTKDMTAAEHRLKPNGLHTKDGGDWNGVWENWMGKNPNATRAQVLRQLQKMKKDFKIK